MMDETAINPMHRKPLPMQTSPRCQARSKRTGLPCRNPAVRGKRVCRMHGAHGGAPAGECNGRYRHGRYTREAITRRAYVQALLRACRDQIEALD